MNNTIHTQFQNLLTQILKSKKIVLIKLNKLTIRQTTDNSGGFTEV